MTCATAARFPFAALPRFTATDVCTDLIEAPLSALPSKKMARFPAQTFFCGGRLMAGPAWTSLFGTTLLVLGPSVVFCVLVVPEVAREYNWVLLAVAIWLAAFSIAMLLVTGCSDPGIIPPLPPPGAEEFPNGRPRCARRVPNSHSRDSGCF